FDVSTADWLGLGVFESVRERNLSGHSDGKLHVQVKTQTTEKLSFGIISSAATGSEVHVDITGNQYGLVRDGNWHEVVIPMNAFGNGDFYSVIHTFMLVGGQP